MVPGQGNQVRVWGLKSLWVWMSETAMQVDGNGRIGVSLRKISWTPNTKRQKLSALNPEKPGSVEVFGPIIGFS